MLPRLGLVLVAHHQHGKLRGLANLLVEFALGGVLVGHQRDLSGVAADRLHEEVALAVDRTEAPVLDLQQLVGDARGFQPVAEIGGEHAQLLPLGELRVFPEQALDLAPGEEVGMHDLVRIAAEQEVAWLLQGPEDQRQLHGGDVLDFVDDHEVVARRRQRLPVLGDEIEIVEPGFGEPAAILLEQIVELVAQIDRKDRLAHAERQIVGARHDAAGAGREHAADLLEGLMAVELPERLPHAREPAGEVAPGRLPTRWHADRFDELAVGEENRLLPVCSKPLA
jgi:hypothetical protein